MDGRLMSANDILARLWDDRLMQLAIIDGYVWKHLPGGNWYVVRSLDE
jgi:hypothetical protein